jgi:subtilisin-like proprotein convertase family protein
MKRFYLPYRPVIGLTTLLLVGLYLLVRTPEPFRKPSSCYHQVMTDREVAAYRNLSVAMVERLHTQMGLTNSELCAMSAEQLKEVVNEAEHPKPAHPGEALAWRRLQWQNENGEIPPDGLMRAAEQLEQMQTYQQDSPPPANSQPLSAGELQAVQLPLDGEEAFDSGSWSWLGPGNIGGRVRSLWIHPTNPNIMLAGSVGGGLWRTTDGGAIWWPVDDFMANLAVATIVMQPGDPNILYAGTGEGFYNIDSIRGAGVFMSVNGGSSWSHLPSTAGSNWYYVNRLTIAANGGAMLAATGSGIWRSTNGGGSWSQVNSDGAIKDVDYHPTNSNLAIASGSYGRAYYSTNGGQNWNAASGLPVLDWLGRVEVGYAPSNPTIVYASVSWNSGELWKSTNGGQSYTLINTGNNYLGGQGWYDNAVWVDPTNPDVVIVGGIDLWRSMNGGATLTKISEWWRAPSSAHADHHIIVQHPAYNGSSNRIVFFGNDGGVYKTNDVYTVQSGPPPNGWQELNNNLGITQFYGAAGNPTTGIIIGGTQDNGTLRYSGSSEAWTTMFGGDGGFNAADPTNGNYFYGEYVVLQIHRSTNGGISSSYITSGLGDAGTCANFIAPFILDPNNPNTMLAGGCSLWRSTNIKATTPAWSVIKGSINSNVSAIAVAAGNPDIIWVGHNGGEVYKTTNGTAANPSWTRVDNNSPGLPNRFVTRLTIDPTNHDRVYASFGGFSPDNIWRTSNGGASWQDASGSGVTGLPDAPVRSLVIHPSNPNFIYAGTEVGIFTSMDMGNQWLLPHGGPANVSVDELFWMRNRLVSASHGRGLFETDLGVTAEGVWTADGAWGYKTIYNQGDPAQWIINVENDTGLDTQVELTYEVLDPNNQQVVFWQGMVTTGAGVWGWGLPGTIGTTPGYYTFYGSAYYQGELTQAVATYYVRGPLVCTTYVSSDVPKTISSVGTPSVDSVLTVSNSGIIADVNVVALNGTHTWIQDLDFSLQSPAGTWVQLMEQSCNDEDNFNLSLDDEAIPGSWPCPPADGGVYRPSYPTLAFDGENKSGVWTLHIDDNGNLDGGALNGWGLQICEETTITPTPTHTPSPTNTHTPTPTRTPTPSPTNTHTPTPTRTPTPSPTNTHTPTPTRTPTPSPTNTHTPLPTSSNTPLPTHTNTPIPTHTDTPAATHTLTPVPTATLTPTPTAPPPAYRLYLPAIIGLP